MNAQQLQTTLNHLLFEVIDINGLLYLEQNQLRSQIHRYPTEREPWSLQRDLNRRFIVADILDEVCVPSLRVAEYGSQNIYSVANAVWLFTLGYMEANHSGRGVVVEKIGFEAVEDEPLEVAVSFYQR